MAPVSVLLCSTRGRWALQRGRFLSHTNDSSTPNVQLSAVEQSKPVTYHDYSDVEPCVATGQKVVLGVDLRSVWSI